MGATSTVPPGPTPLHGLRHLSSSLVQTPHSLNTETTNNNGLNTREVYFSFTSNGPAVSGAGTAWQLRGVWDAGVFCVLALLLLCCCPVCTIPYVSPALCSLASEKGPKRKREHLSPLKASPRSCFYRLCTRTPSHMVLSISKEGWKYSFYLEHPRTKLKAPGSSPTDRGEKGSPSPCPLHLPSAKL